MQVGDKILGGTVLHIFTENDNLSNLCPIYDQVYVDSIFNTGETHGLIISEILGQAIWGSTGNTGASGVTIGTGYDNTQYIIQNNIDITAAHLCVNYSGGGYTDWFLPSNDEAVYFQCLAWNYVDEFLTGGTEDTDENRYWTSTEINNDLFANDWNPDYMDSKIALSQCTNHSTDTWDCVYLFPMWQYFGSRPKEMELFVRAVRYF